MKTFRGDFHIFSIYVRPVLRVVSCSNIRDLLMQYCYFRKGVSDCYCYCKRDNVDNLLVKGLIPIIGEKYYVMNLKI